MATPYQLQALNSLIGRLTTLPADSTVANQAGVLLRRIQKESTLLVEIKPDADRSDAFNATVRNNEATKHRALVEKTRGELNLLTSAFRTEQQKARNEKANLKEGPHSAEIRAVFRGLDSQAKHAFLNEAIKNGDSEAIAALTKVPAVLVGLPAETQGKYEQAFLAKYSPDDTRTIDELQSIIDVSLQMAEQLGAPAAAPGSLPMPKIFDGNGVEIPAPVSAGSTV